MNNHTENTAKRTTSTNYKMKNNGVKLKVDTSPRHMKKVKEFFKDIDHIKVPYSGVELLKMVRERGKMPAISSR